MRPMATTSNLFVLRENPPELGKIVGDAEDAALMIRAFLIKRRKFIKRHKDSEVKIPSLAQMMEEEDLEQISRVAVARFKSLDKMAHPEEYRQRDREDEDNQVNEERSDEDEDEEDEDEGSSKGDGRTRGGTNLSEVLESESKESSDASSDRYLITAGRLIKNRLIAFEKQVFSEENILATLRWMYGPKSLVQAHELLKSIKMSKNGAPYRSLQ